ncbi:MAG TPA: hypothetical protein VK070_03850 [Acidimicrobiia bacterium]|nr:hypothetical protein [Acidimicrobiia bacterium]
MGRGVGNGLAKLGKAQDQSERSQQDGDNRQDLVKAGRGRRVRVAGVRRGFAFD